MKDPTDELRDAMESGQRISQERREVGVAGYDANAPKRGPVGWLFGKFMILLGLLLVLSLIAMVTGNADALAGLASSVRDALPW